MDIASLRREYSRESLDEADVDRDPIAQFGQWFDEALKSELREPTAMAVSTVGADGRPSSRMVLLKGCDARGFVFFTNYASRKGRELAANPHASLLFFWAELERQVRIDGAIGKASAAESDEYYATRPLGARD
jgi:pyridoxamine 5'-phosphate oxidase